jgi:AcrR family transcriptional regulator
VSPRRAPRPDERQRDPERSKAAILDAALVEFSEHGYAGARTVAIARRAGVNPQLISYYFDGKAGLYRALNQQWHATSAPLSDLAVPLSQVMVNFVHANAAHRQWARMLVWEGLASTGGDSDEPNPFSEMVEGVRERQRRGELAADLDPATVLIVLFSAALAPTSLPHVLTQIAGTPVGSEEFLTRYADGLRRLVERLAAK